MAAPRIHGRRRGGLLLMTALVISAIMMLWAVAATCRANYQTNITLLGFRKSEVYYLAKRGISRGLHKLNSAGGWRSAHTGVGNADTGLVTTALSGPTAGLPEGGECKVWVDTGSGSTTLLCKATIGTQSTTLDVPIMSISGPSSTRIYSVTPAQGSGPDAIAWIATSSTTPVWTSLPPIPTAKKVISTAQTPSGDVYAVCSTAPPGPVTMLWRYRPGAGWIQMPPVPTGIEISSLSAGGNGIVCLASDNSGSSNNTLLILPLGDDITQELEWYKVPGPSGMALSNVATNPNDPDVGGTGAGRVYVSGNTSGHLALSEADTTGMYNVTTMTITAGISDTNVAAGTPPTWHSLPLPSAVGYTYLGAASTPASPEVPNFSGGLVVDKSGTLYAASNPQDPNAASVVYSCQPTASPVTWSHLPPIAAFDYNGVGVAAGFFGSNQFYTADFANNVTHLQTDNKNRLYVQWTEPGTSQYTNLSLPNTPAP